MHVRPTFRAVSAALLSLLIGGTPSLVPAQPLFALECALTSGAARGSFTAETTYRMLVDTGRMTYEGEDPVEGRILVFFLGDGGEIQGTMTTDPFEMAPGSRALDDLIRGDMFRETVEQFLPGDQHTVQSTFAPEEVSISDFDSEDRMLKIVYEKIQWKHDGSGGVGLALVLIIGRYIQDWDEVRVPPTGISGSAAR